MSLAVVATGNHFVADIVAGVIVTVAGYAVGRAASRVTAAEPTLAPVPAMARAG